MARGWPTHPCRDALPPLEKREAAKRMVYFKGRVEHVAVDAMMVIDGDSDPYMKGNEAHRVLAAAGPNLQAASMERGARGVSELRITPGFNLPCQWLVQAVPHNGRR